MRHGAHILSWWCKLQSRVAFSSCEAELNSSLKGAIEGLNAQRLAQSFGDHLGLELRTDASVARGVVMRQGGGKVRHLHAKQLWLQEAVANGDLAIHKIPRAENCSDALTHAWTSADLKFWNEMGLRCSPAAPQAEKGEPTWSANPAAKTSSTYHRVWVKLLIL